MPELPYRWTDSKDTELIIDTDGIGVWDSTEGTYVDPPTDAVAVARAVLDAAGDTEHRVVSEDWLITVIKINREDAARSMCDRAAEEIQRAWPRLTDPRTPAEQCHQVVRAVRDLPLLVDGEVAHSGCSHETSEQPSEQPSDHITLAVPDSPKMLHETLCFAASAVGLHPDQSRAPEHTKRLSRLIAECERHRPLGTDGKHGDLHTATCGCDDVHYDPPRNPTEPASKPCGSVFTGATGIDYVCTQPPGHALFHRNTGGTAAWNTDTGEAATLTALTRRVNDLEEALAEATDLLAAYQTDQAAIQGRLDSLESAMASRKDNESYLAKHVGELLRRLAAVESTGGDRAQSGGAAHTLATRLGRPARYRDRHGDVWQTHNSRDLRLIAVAPERRAELGTVLSRDVVEKQRGILATLPATFTEEADH